MKFEERVLNESYKFTEMETEIVDYIQENIQKIDQFKIQSLAKQFYTVPNTITRLCHKLGYSGFSELKHVVKYEQEEAGNLRNQQQLPLARNFDLIDDQREAKVVELMQSAKRIQFAAQCPTAPAAKILVANFYAIDHKSYFSSDITELQHNLIQDQTDLFFLIDNSGTNREMLALARAVKNQGDKKIVSLTHLQKNPLAALTDQSLYCFAPNQAIQDHHENQPITDIAPLTIIMDSLFQAYSQKLGKVLQLG